MKPQGRKKTTTLGPGHQHCGECHPDTKNKKAVERTEVAREITAETLTVISTSPLPNEPHDRICAYCGLRPGWRWWSNGGTDFARGYRSAVCELCCVRKKLVHARERAAKIPALEARLQELEAENG